MNPVSMTDGIAYCEGLSLTELAKTFGTKTARVNLRINPNIKADTNAKITTGTYSNKFGIPEAEATELAQSLRAGQVELTGLTCHIGSQLTDLAPLKQAWSFSKVSWAKIRSRFKFIPR